MKAAGPCVWPNSEPTCRPSLVLLEGIKPGTAPLVLGITDQAENQVFTTGLNLSLDGVEQMFRHVNLISAVSGYPPVSGTKWGETDRLDVPKNCPDDVCIGSDGTDFVFVHGYNVDGQQARGWHSEMFKRMFWSGSRSRFWGVDWYGSESQLFNAVTVNYQINVQNAIKTAPAFRSFLNKQMQGSTSIAAHSLGNMLVASALADQPTYQPLTAPIAKFFMIDAAVATEAFTGGEVPTVYDGSNKMVHPDWWGYKSILGASEWYRLFYNAQINGEPDARSTLTWRDRFKGLPQTISYYNFYSSGEDILAEHEGVPSFLSATGEGGRTIWAQQEKLKGSMPLGYLLSSSYGGWGFNRDDYLEKFYDENGFTGYRVWLSGKANSIAENDLKTVPFFDGGSAFGSLFSSIGPGNSVVRNNRDKWLAEAFPSLTGAAGGPEGVRLNTTFNPDNVIDMESKISNGWPRERIDQEIEGWRHSDLKNVSYTYIYKIFDNMVNVTGEK